MFFKKEYLFCAFVLLLGLFLSVSSVSAITTISTDINTGGALTVAGLTNLNGNMVLGDAGSDTLILTVATTTFADGSTLSAGNLNSTTLTSILLTPNASVGTSDNYYKLVGIGDITGNTAFGFGDATKPTTGIMASFGRTTAATAAITDTGLDVRVMNNYDSSGTTYKMQGAYIKAKNYSSGKLDTLKGLFIEAVNAGSAATTGAYGLDIGTDGTTISSLIHLTSGLAAYGIDMAGATFGTADIRLKNSDTISNSSAGTISVSGILTAATTTASTAMVVPTGTIHYGASCTNSAVGAMRVDTTGKKTLLWCDGTIWEAVATSTTAY